jgi:hypothetical protein
MKLQVSFSDPENGWIEIRIQCGKQEFCGQMSHTPYPSFEELASSLSLLAQGVPNTSARWNGEPHHYDFRFQQSDGRIHLEILSLPQFSAPKLNAETVLLATGTFNDICRPFWKAVCDLRGRLSDEDLTRRWHRPFPAEQFERLGIHFRRLPSQKS